MNAPTGMLAPLRFRPPLGATLAASVEIIDRGEEPDAEPAKDLAHALGRARLELTGVEDAMLRALARAQEGYRIDPQLIARAAKAAYAVFDAIAAYRMRHPS